MGFDLKWFTEGNRPIFFGLPLTIGAVLMVSKLDAVFSPNPLSDPAATPSAASAETSESSGNGLTGAAPKGNPSVVAEAAIHQAGHKCSGVRQAVRLEQDGSIEAICKGGQRYRVFTVKDVGVVALNCDAAARLNIAGC